jgi:hypothetical protein
LWVGDGVDLASPTSKPKLNRAGEAFFAHVRLFSLSRACVSSNPVAVPAPVFDHRRHTNASWVVVFFELAGRGGSFRPALHFLPQSGILRSDLGPVATPECPIEVAVVCVALVSAFCVVSVAVRSSIFMLDLLHCSVDLEAFTSEAVGVARVASIVSGDLYW